jgi:hypothetical protein
VELLPDLFFRRTIRSKAKSWKLREKTPFQLGKEETVSRLLTESARSAIGVLPPGARRQKVEAGRSISFGPSFEIIDLRES